jgi:hypothetical protein
MLQQGPKVAAGTVSINVTAPAYEDLSSGSDSEDESEQRPLNRTELMNKSLHLLTKNGLQPHSHGGN